jgi:LacI family transcriptional regulator
MVGHPVYLRSGHWVGELKMFGSKVDHSLSLAAKNTVCLKFGLKIPCQAADITCRLTKLTPSKSLHIAVVAPSSPGGFFSVMWKGIWNAACELAPFGVRLDSYETDGHDVTAQHRILGNLRDNPPAALALVPAHESELDARIAQLSRLKVPVVTFHTDAPASAREIYVGTDPAQSGALAGEMMALMLRGAGTIASFPGSLETGHLKQRYLAFRKQLKLRAPDVKESFTHAGYEGLAEAVERALYGGEQVAGIYVGCSRSHTVARVLLQSGKQIPCVGFDLTDLSKPYLTNGVLSALIDEDVYHQGYLAVHHAYEAACSGVLRFSTEGPTVCPPLQASVILGANANGLEKSENDSDPFERLIRLRTNRVARYQELLSHATAQVNTLLETDPLTGLLNRSKFEELLALRARDQAKLSILMISLEGFEQTVAQNVNDEALRTVAKLLRKVGRSHDECARIGGNEFGVLMPGADAYAAAGARDRLLAALSKTVIAPQTLRLGIRVSIGAASLPEDASNPEDLLIRADNALYVHKRALQ